MLVLCYININTVICYIDIFKYTNDGQCSNTINMNNPILFNDFKTRINILNLILTIYNNLISLPILWTQI